MPDAAPPRAAVLPLAIEAGPLSCSATAICWRRARFSSTRSERERPRARRLWNSTVRTRRRAFMVPMLARDQGSLQRADETRRRGRLWVSGWEALYFHDA